MGDVNINEALGERNCHAYSCCEDLAHKEQTGYAQGS